MDEIARHDSQQYGGVSLLAPLDNPLQVNGFHADVHMLGR